MKKRMFCIFEGGGARGISHVGVLSAIESLNRFNIIGYAGTSAGALVASLAAVGYKSSEIFSTNDDGTITSIFDNIDDENIAIPVHLFKSNQWWLFKFWRFLLFKLHKFWLGMSVFLIGLILLYPLFWVGVAIVTTDTNIGDFRGGSLSIIMWMIYSITAILLTLSSIIFINQYRGIISLRKFVDSFDEILAKKLDKSTDGKITFQDLHDTGIQLKIVTSDLSNKNLTLFSTERASSLSVGVAEAVAASIAIPFVFRPITIDKSIFCDGGIVSNLPAWTFDAETLNDYKCWIATSEISGENPSKKKKRKFSGVQLVGRTLSTILSGASDLDTRGLTQHISIPLTSSLDVYEFDAAPSKMEFNVTQAAISAYLRLSTRLEEESKLFDIHDEVLEVLKRELGLDSNPRLRSALAREVRLTKSEAAAFHLWACCGFEPDADEHLTIPTRGSMIEKCLESGAPVFLDLCSSNGDSEFHAPFNGDYLRKVTPSDRKWSMVLPLSPEPSKPVFGPNIFEIKDFKISKCITFDCDIPLNSKEGTCKDAIEDLVFRLWSEESF